MIQLRDYQELAVSHTRQSLKKHKRTILNACCGFGKTVTSAYICQQALEKGTKVLVLVHRLEILQQFYQTFRQFDITPSLIAAGKKPPMGQQFYLGMVDTFRRRMKQPNFYQQFQDYLLICDEVHWGTYEKIVDGFGGYSIGLTATPKAASGKELNQYYSDCICPVGVKDLIDMGNLLKGRTYSIDYDFSKVKMSGKDFNTDALMQEFRSPTLFEGVIENYEAHAKGRKAICYSVNVQHSIDTRNHFEQAGYKAYHVDANSEGREDIFSMFRESDDAILCNVGIATTGYDEPSVGCIIQNFATAQITKQHQTIGRGARPNGVDEDFVIIDMGRNYLRHGMYGEDIDWVSIFNNPSLGKTKKEESQIKNIECATCGAIVSMSLSECPYCEEEISQKDKEEKILEHGTTQEIKEYRLQNLPANLRIPISHMSYAQLKEYGRHLGYNPKWAQVQMRFRKHKPSHKK